MKKILCVLLCVVMVVAMTSMAVVSTSAVISNIFTVAGDAGLTGVTWDPAATANELTKTEATVDEVAYNYQKTFDNVAKGSYTFKITDGTWSNSWGADDGSNYAFVLSGDCPVTIYFNSSSKKIAVVAEFLSTFTFETMSLAGNGSGAWLNGVSWDPASTANDMTEVSPGVFEITYENVPAGSTYQFKFVVNHSWTYNWTSDGVFDGQANPNNVVEKDGSTVKITFDISAFKFDKKVGKVVPTFTVTPPEGGDEPVMGDADGDGTLTIIDVTYIQRYLAKLVDEVDEEICDYDIDGDVTIMDCTAIQYELAGLVKG